MKKILLLMAFAAILAVAAYAQMDEVTGEFKNHRMMQDGRMMWGAQQYYEGKQRMHLGAGILAGLAISGFILAEWLFVIKLYREVFKKK